MSPTENTRSLQATDPQLNASVHASAGTGKTWLLVTRVLRLLLAGAKPDSILAITFTRKAAAEMEQRVMERLQELLYATPEELDGLLEQSGMQPNAALRQRAQQLYEQLLCSPRRLRCTTFHAFCQELLQRFPLEAGIAPGFEVSESTGLLEQAARDALLAATARDPDGVLADTLATLVEGCNGLFNAHAALRSFVAHRSDWWAWTQGRDDPASFASQELASYFDIDPQADPLSGYPDAGQRGRMTEFTVLLGRNETKTNLTYADVLAAALAESLDAAAFLDAITPVFLTQAGVPLKTRKCGKAQQKRLGEAGEQRFLALHEEISAELLALRDDRARHANWHTTTAWYTAGAELLTHYTRIKREQRVLDFTDMEWLACRLLNHGEHASWVQYKLDARIDHLLIDEFQDTNPTQWQLLRPLLQELADNDDERRRSVFLVGDKKQSIYSFRRANPALLDTASGWLDSHMQGGQYPLDASRRSAAAIMECVNAVFSIPPLADRLTGFNRHTTHLQAQYGRVELLPLQEATRDDPDETAETDAKELRNPLLQPRQVAEDAHYAAEGRLIAEQIRQLVAGHTLIEKGNGSHALDYSDVLILLRQRTHAHVYETALRDAGIPFQSASKGLLLENLEVRDLVALLNVLISPFDNLALAQVLRAPLFGLDSEQLLPLSGDNSQTWYQRLEQLAQNGSSPYREVHTLLQHWRELAGEVPVHDLLDRIFHEGEVVQRYEAAFPPALTARLRASLTRFIELALEIDNGRYPSLPRFLDQLSRLHQSDGDQPDDSTPEDDGDQRVRLLTIHGAKGLEAPVVFLADAAATPGDRNAHATALDWPNEADRPQAMLLAGSRKNRDSITQKLLDQQAETSIQEDANLLYVALTRARQYLYISGSRGKSKGQTWYDLISTALQEWDRTAAGHPFCESGKQAVAASICTDERPQAVIDPRLAQPVKTAPQLIRIAPSRMDYAQSTANGDADGRERGIAIHAMLDGLTQAGRPDDTTLLMNITTRLQRDPDDPDIMECWNTALNTISDPDLATLFDEAHFTRAFNETPVQYLDGKRLVYGVIDRIVLDDVSVTLIDYKTHTGATAESIPQLTDHYRLQMQYYRLAAARLWPQHSIRAGLLFTACNELVWLDGLQSPELSL